MRTVTFSYNILYIRALYGRLFIVRAGSSHAAAGQTHETPLRNSPRTEPLAGALGLGVGGVGGRKVVGGSCAGGVDGNGRRG
jgi:hypothetical protein